MVVLWKRDEKYHTYWKGLVISGGGVRFVVLLLPVASLVAPVAGPSAMVQQG
jgi:hypothetical protein